MKVILIAPNFFEDLLEAAQVRAEQAAHERANSKKDTGTDKSLLPMNLQLFAGETDIIQHVDDLHELKPTVFNDNGNARSFLAWLNAQPFFPICYAMGKGWMVWDNSTFTWKADDTTTRVLQYVKAWADDMRTHAIKYDWSDGGAYLKHATASGNIRKQQNVITSIAADLVRPAKDFDNSPYAIHAKGQVFSLSQAHDFMEWDDKEDPTAIGKGKLVQSRIAQPKDKDTWTKTCGEWAEELKGKKLVTDGDAAKWKEWDNSHLWDAFLTVLTNGDTDLQHYLQVYMGSTLIGKVTNESLLIAQGDGDNGKSTFFNAISLVLGDFAGTLNSNALTIDNPDKNFSYAGLAGKRLVLLSELEHRKTLSTKAVKDLATTDKILINEKYKAAYEVTPTHHCVLVTNVFPALDSLDNGITRRIKVIRFTAHMPKDNTRKQNYAQTLAWDAGESIFQWLIEGAREFCEQGEQLPRCAKVEADTIAYFADADPIGLFLNDCYEKVTSGEERTADVWRNYCQYCKENGFDISPRTAFIQDLKDHGLTMRHGRSHLVYWCGIKRLEE